MHQHPVNPHCVYDNSTTVIQQYSSKNADVCQAESGAGIADKKKLPNRITEGNQYEGSKHYSTKINKQGHLGSPPTISGQLCQSEVGSLDITTATTATTTTTSAATTATITTTTTTTTTTATTTTTTEEQYITRVMNKSSCSIFFLFLGLVLVW